MNKEETIKLMASAHKYYSDEELLNIMSDYYTDIVQQGDKRLVENFRKIMEHIAFKYPYVWEDIQKHLKPI